MNVFNILTIRIEIVIR